MCSQFAGYCPHPLPILLPMVLYSPLLFSRDQDYAQSVHPYFTDRDMRAGILGWV